MRTKCAKRVTWSFRMSLNRWQHAVLNVMPKSDAISTVERPSAIRVKTSVSRRVREAISDSVLRPLRLLAGIRLVASIAAVADMR
jgi:hypothetical protein